MNEFKVWLDSGAPSDDANEEKHKPRRSEEPESSPFAGPVAGAVSNSCLCTVELFGVPRLLAKTKEISLALPPDATLAHVYLALAEKLPVLLGRVISPDGDSLSSGYACNVNGLDFVRTPTAKVNSGDRIFILSADAGG